MLSLSQDIRYALRGMRANPGFFLVAVLTLALGIGANTAIFSLVNAVLLSPLPFPDPDRLVVIRTTDHGREYSGPSAPDGLDYARSNHTLEHFVMFDYWRKNVSGIGNMQPEEMPVGLTPAEYFDTLGIRATLGRLFSADEGLFGRHFVAVISDSFWRNRFAADPRVLGRTLRINDEIYTVIGVVPDAIPFWMSHLAGKSAQIWTPMTPYPDFFDESTRGTRGTDNIARLKRGVTLEQAQTDLELVARQLAAQYPVDGGVGVRVGRLADERTGSVRTSLLLLFGAVGMILLIACANVANLIVVRNTSRRREFAVRAALGGARADIVRQPLIESALLAGVGGFLGVLLAVAGQQLIAAVRPDRLPQLASVAIDAKVLLFTLALSMLVTVLFGLSPALTAARIDVVEALKEGSRSSTSGRARVQLRRLLVVTEIALSLMLMIGAGLLVRSIARLQAQELGFRSDHLLRAHLYLPPARYLDSPSLTRFVDAFADRARALPGVRESTITSLLPPSNRWDQPFSVVGQPAGPSEQLPSVSFGVADEHVLATYGIPLIAGRNFAPTDTPDRTNVAVVNQTLVQRFFPNENPIGKRVHLGQPGTSPVAGSARASVDLTIVGVMGDVRNRGLAEPVEPQVIALYRQIPALNFGFKEIVVRTSQEPHAIAAALADALRRMDPEMPLAEVATIDELIGQQTSDRRFTTALLGIFAVLGIVLAIVGVYGVISYLVSERRHEIGLRMALGARRGNVIWIVMRPSLVMGGIGTALGLAGAWEMRQIADALVFGVSTADPATYAGGAAILLVAVIAATAIPARRATRVDPMVALRGE
jgi:putative ABC transport system permease protein